MDQILTASSTLFLWLVDYTRDITILICLIFLFKLIVGKKLPSWWHYSIWLILLVRMVIPWEYKNLFNISSSIPVPISDRLLDIILFDEGMLIPVLNSGVSSADQVWNISLPNILLFLWVLGALIFGVYILINNIRFWINIKDEPSLSDNKTHSLLEECKKRMKISNCPKIIITDKIKSPSLFGYFQPKLLLPEGILEKLNDTELTYVFMHELGHLKHHDVGISWLMVLLQVVHWFNPLVWFAFYRIRVDQESACDEYVLSQITYNKSTEYADAILGFLDKFCRNRRMPTMVGILENKSQIKRRLAMIVNYRKYSKKITATSIVMLFIAGFIFFTLTGYAKEEQSNMTGHEINRPTLQNFKPRKPGDPADKTTIIIGITKEGEIWIENQKVDIDSIGSRVERFYKEYPEGKVLIAGDRDTPLGTTLEVLDKVKMTGITNVFVATVID